MKEFWYMKKALILFLATLFILTSVTAGYADESRGPLSALYDSVLDLLFKTSNVTVTGEAVFSLDAERFKTAKAKYIQDDDRSFWDLKLSAPKPDGKERENGYTVIADGSKIYVMEVYRPREYKTGTGKPQSTIMRESVQLDLMKELILSAVSRAENSQSGKWISITDNKDDSTIRIELNENVPSYINTTLDIFRQYLTKRYFRMDYDQISERQMVPMSSYLTVTEGILACTKSVSVRYADIHAAYDPKGGLDQISGVVSLRLDTAKDGTRLLDITFFADVSDRGTSHVNPFSPKEYDVKLAAGAMDIENTEYTEVDDKTADKLTELAKTAWTQAGYQLDPSTYGYSYKQNGRYCTVLTDVNNAQTLNCITDTSGKILELRNTGNPWQDSSFNYEDSYPDPVTAEDAANKVLAYLGQVNPGIMKRIERLKIQCWLEQGGEVYLEFCEDPIAQDWDGILFVVRVRPDWQLEYYSCFSNG